MEQWGCVCDCRNRDVELGDNTRLWYPTSSRAMFFLYRFYCTKLLDTLDITIRILIHNTNSSLPLNCQCESVARRMLNDWEISLTRLSACSSFTTAWMRRNRVDYHWSLPNLKETSIGIAAFTSDNISAGLKYMNNTMICYLSLCSIRAGSWKPSGPSWKKS
jgi:hypothetical protein